jgi:hypothetical protein
MADGKTNFSEPNSVKYSTKFNLCLSKRNLRLNKIVVISVSENISVREFYHLFHEISSVWKQLHSTEV